MFQRQSNLSVLSERKQKSKPPRDQASQLPRSRATYLYFASFILFCFAMSTAPLFAKFNSENFTTPFLSVDGNKVNDDDEFMMITKNSELVEPLEIGDGTEASRHQHQHSPNRRCQLLKLVMGVVAVVYSLNIAYSMGEEEGVNETLEAFGIDDQLQDAGFDDDWEDTSTKELMENEVAFADSHPNGKRAFSLLLLKQADYELIFDDAYREKALSEHVEDFVFYYANSVNDDISVTLTWRGGWGESYQETYDGLMPYSERTISDIPLVNGDFTGLAILSNVNAQYPTTNILFKEGENTWEMQCDALKAQECIDLAQSSLVRVSEEEFVKTIDDLQE